MGKRIEVLHVERPTPERRQRLGAEQRRESILRAAVEVFGAHGYRAGKVSDVAARVGVTEPVIFQNFGSKAALYAAVIERTVEEVNAHLDATLQRRGSAAAVLLHVLAPGRPSREHPSPLHAALFADAVALAAEPLLKEPAARAAQSVAQHLADLVRRGQSDGDIDSSIAPDAAAWMLLSVLAGRPARTTLMPKRKGLEHDVSALALLALGIGSAQRTGHPRGGKHCAPAAVATAREQS